VPPWSRDERVLHGRRLGSGLRLRPHAAAGPLAVGRGRGERRLAPATHTEGEREGPSGEGEELQVWSPCLA
jgi:hypothetical protein